VLHTVATMHNYVGPTNVIRFCHSCCLYVRNNFISEEKIAIFNDFYVIMKVWNNYK